MSDFSYSPPPPPLPSEALQPPTPPRKTSWYKRWWGIALITTFSLFFISAAMAGVIEGYTETDSASSEVEPQVLGATEEAPETTESPPPAAAEQPPPVRQPSPTPQPPQESRSAYGTYGSDPALDRLYDLCANGDMGACDDLFMDSPFGSAYETFGDTCGGLQSAEGGVWCADLNTGTSLLDRLWSECDRGNMTSCDELYIEAPFGSSYERFGDTCGNRQSANTDRWCDSNSSSELDEQIHELALLFVWEELSFLEKDVFCEGYWTFGPELAYQYFIDGYGSDPPSLSLFRSFFEPRC